MTYQRTLKELSKHAILHWPVALRDSATDLSTLPLLLETQAQFLSVLKIASKSPESWKHVLKESDDLADAVFLKHLMVLSDVGGEALNKLSPLSSYIPNSKMVFSWNGVRHSYKFQEIGNKCNLTNSGLGVTSKALVQLKDLSPRGEDVCMLLLFGYLLSNDRLPPEIKERCIIGQYLGRPNELEEFVIQRYIHVSKQVSGATSNTLGQLAQNYVKDLLQKALESHYGWQLISGGKLPGVTHNVEGNDTTFDIVAISPTNKHFGIEVSFQVTTNSVIERKARESASLLSAVHKAGHKMCYVIDGAGNIKVRENAVGILCRNSDCTVAMSSREIEHLANYLKSV